MATGSVTYNPQSGHSVVTLAGTVKNDGIFATQPVVGDQIVYPDTISVSSDLTVTGDPGNYELWHIIASTGQAVHTVYGIAGGGTVTYNPPAGHSVVTLSGTVAANPNFTVQPVAGDQIVYPDALTVTAQLVVSGASGSYTMWHVVATTGTVYNTTYFIGDEVASGSISYTAGPEYTTATLDPGYDPYVFEGWDPLPVAGEQLTTRTADGYFNSNGDYITDLEHEHDAWHTALDGTITHFLVDSRMQQGDDITPDVPVFTALTNQPVDTLVESNAITVTGIDAGFDIPVSASAGASYSISQDSGATWSAFTTTPGFVSLNDQVKLRLRTSINESTASTATLTLNNISASWSVTTTAGDVITSPNQFTFTDVTDASLSTVYESNPVTILGMSDGVTATATVQGGEWAKSTDSGVTYSAYSTAAGTVSNGDLVKLRATASGTPSALVNVTFTAETVQDTWTITSEAPDLIPNQFTFNDVISATVSTQYESNAITVSGISPGFSTTVSILNGEWAKSTDNGVTYGAWTSGSGSVFQGDLVKLRKTSSANNLVTSNVALTIGGVSDTWTITTGAAVEEPELDAVFFFPSLIGQDLSTQVESQPVVVSGVTPSLGAVISITGGEYAISTNDGATYSAYTSADGTIDAGDYVKLRATSSASYSTKINAVLSVGDYSVSWSVTTKAQAISQFNVFDPDVFLNKFYGEKYRARVVNGSSNWLSFYIYNAGSYIDLSNMTEFRILLTGSDGVTNYSKDLTINPSLFDVHASTGRIDAKLGRFEAPDGMYYLDLIYYDATHINGAYLTSKRQIVIDLV